MTSSLVSFLIHVAWWRKQSLHEITLHHDWQWSHLNDYYHCAHSGIQKHTKEAEDDPILVNNKEKRKDQG